MTFTILLSITLILALIFWRNTRKPIHFPPGPFWWPILGALPQVLKLVKKSKFYYLAWERLAKVYGPVVGLKLGPNKMIIVSGNEMIKEFYRNENFDGRPDGFFFRMRSFGERLGIVFSDGLIWEEERRLSTRLLKQVGLGKSKMHEIMEMEAYELVDDFRRKSADSVQMKNAFDIPLLNVIWALMSGKRFNYEDKKLFELDEMIHAGFKVVDMSGGILNLYPAVRHIFPEKSGYLPLLRAIQPLWNFLRQAVTEMRESHEENDSLISEYLNEMRNHPESHNEEKLLSICIDLFQAGSETSSNTLSFAILYILHRPYVVQKMRQELDAVVGPSRLPSLSDRLKLKYTEAVIMEVLRLSSIAPMALVHRALRQTKLGGYVIPENTLAMITLKSLHMDAGYWKDPDIFRPERFLDSCGNLIQHEYFHPFGAGKRRCIGENLAKHSIFLFLASFVYSFEISAVEQLPVLLDGEDGITLSPKPFSVTLEYRFP